MKSNIFVDSLEPYKLSQHAAWNYIGDPELLKLDWNESTFKPSPLVTKALYELVQSGTLNYYPDTNNYKLKEKLAKYSATNKENLEFYSSSDGAHEYLFRAFGNPKDNLLIVGPTYDNLRVVAQSAGLVITYLNLLRENSFCPEYKLLETELFKTNPDFVYLCNPNNPTSTLWSTSELERLIYENKNTMFIIDEAYYEFNGRSLAQLASKVKNLIVSRTFSKAFGLAGIRFGYLISCPENIEIIGRIRNGKSVNSFAQAAVMAAIEDEAYMKTNVAEVMKAKKYFEKNLMDLGISTFGGEAGNFILCDFGEGALNIIKSLEQKKIFVRALPKLESGGFIRITIGSIPDMDRVLNIIKTSL